MERFRQSGKRNQESALIDTNNGLPDANIQKDESRSPSRARGSFGVRHYTCRRVGTDLETNLIFPILRQKAVYIYMHPSFLSFAEKNTRATNL
jgi:hypothetical protein